ncbi:MAG: flavin reductase family protein [Peptococcaceae bacterium]|nr:flavin reductase family protein [Peptococcaceae bacterium]
MRKVTKTPSTTLFPVPNVLVSSQLGDKANVLTIAWTGIMNSVPPIVYVSINPSRFSHKLVQESGEYVINIPSADLARAVDYCGVVSGRDIDKFQATGLTPVAATQVKAPLIAECPVNIECRVRQTIELGSHDVFVADVLAVNYSETVLDTAGRPDLAKLNPYGYCLNEYRALGEKLGTFGFSQKQPK